MDIRWSSADLSVSQRAGPEISSGRPADGAAAVERLTESPQCAERTGMSPDGRSLMFTETAPTTGEDVMKMTLTGRVPLRRCYGQRRETEPCRRTDAGWPTRRMTRASSRFCRSAVSRRQQCPLPGVHGGGTGRLGAERAGVMSPTGGLMSVGVARGPSWTATRPQAVVKDGYFTSPGNPGRTYDISPEGQRFLMIKEGSVGQTSSNTGLVVVLNWVEELKRSARALIGRQRNTDPLL